MGRAILREGTTADLDLLVRHRRGMWEAISEIPSKELDALDRRYRSWARPRLKSGRLVAFIVETGEGHAAASGCLWISPSQPRPGWRKLSYPYLMSMYTEKEDRGRGHATRIARAAIRWSRAHGYNMMVLHASDQGRRIYEREGFVPTTEMRLRLDGPRPRARVRKTARASRRRRKR